MPNIDSFSSHVVAMVRNMPDDAILELVLHKLTVADAAAAKVVPSAASTPPEASPPATKAKTSTPRRRARVSKTASQPKPAAAKPASAKPAAAKPAAAKPASAKPASAKPASAKASNPAKDSLLAAVEKTIKVSNGLGLAAVSAVVGEPKARVSAAIRELRDQKKIFQAGDRRFARYAGDLKTAKAATIRARTSGG